VFDLKKIKRAHQHFLAELSREVDHVTDARKLTLVAQRAITDNRDIVARTGNLTRRTKAKVIRTGKRRVVKVQNTAKYAWAQDLGSGLHGPKRRKYVIRPKRAKALRFIGKNGSEVITQKMMHPGVKPTRFLYHSADTTGRTLRGWLVTAMSRAATKFR
jgi:hypothetical protein